MVTETLAQHAAQHVQQLLRNYSRSEPEFVRRASISLELLRPKLRGELDFTVGELERIAVEVVLRRCGTLPPRRGQPGPEVRETQDAIDVEMHRNRFDLSGPLPSPRNAGSSV